MPMLISATMLNIYHFIARYFVTLLHITISFPYTMNNLSRKKPSTPTLPDEVIYDIVKLTDAETVQQWKAVNPFWRAKLKTNEFCRETLAKWKTRGHYLIAHLGYVGFKYRLDWIVKLNVMTGDLEEFPLPFDLQPGGWFRVVGIENGNICLRLSSTGRKSKLIVWNPAAKIHRTIDDPTQHYCSMCSFIYSFVYYPDSTSYAIVHLYRRSLGDELCWLTMLSPDTPNWEYNILCPSYVKKLDGHTVSLNGACYWMSWAGDILQYPAYILRFSILTKSFSRIIIPPKAYSNDHQLIIYRGSLGMVSFSSDENDFESTLWKINQQDDANVSWECIFTIRGGGAPEIPLLDCEEHVILLRASFRDALIYHGYPALTEFGFLKFNHNTNQKILFQEEGYAGRVEIKSTNVYHEGCFAV